MKKAMTELIRFGKDMFPGTELSVYVPPSNVAVQMKGGK